MKRTHLVSVLYVLALTGLTTSSFGGGLEDEVDGEIPSLFEIFKYLHANPELSYQEDDTARYVAEELRRLGFEVTEGVGDYGVEGRTSYGVVAVMRERRGSDGHGANRSRWSAGTRKIRVCPTPV